MSSPVSAAPSPDAAIEIASIFGKGCAQVMLVQHDHMIEALAAYASKEALAGGIHVGSAHRRLDNAGPDRFRGSVEVGAELVVAIVKKEPRTLAERRRIAKLLSRPGLRWHSRCSDMRDALGVNIDDEESEDGTEPDIVGLQESKAHTE